MRYRYKTFVDAVKWFPRREYDGAYDPSGVEYSASGWYLDGFVIQPGDYIVHEEGNRYSLSAAEFEAEFEPVEESSLVVNKLHEVETQEDQVND